MMEQGSGGEESSSMIYAKFWKRVCSWIWDELILSVFMLGVFIIFILGLRMSGSEELTGAQRTGFLLFSIPVRMSYLTYYIGSQGRTIGQRIMRLKVALENGGRVGYPCALGRAAAFMLYYVPYMIGGILQVISLIMLIRDPRKRALHDRMSATVVLEESGEGCVESAVNHQGGESGKNPV